MGNKLAEVVSPHPMRETLNIDLKYLKCSIHAYTLEEVICKFEYKGIF